MKLSNNLTISVGTLSEATGKHSTKIVKNKEKIAYCTWEAGYLADQANIQTNQKKEKKLHFELCRNGTFVWNIIKTWRNENIV